MVLSQDHVQRKALILAVLNINEKFISMSGYIVSSSAQPLLNSPVDVPTMPGVLLTTEVNFFTFLNFIYSYRNQTECTGVYKAVHRRAFIQLLVLRYINDFVVIHINKS